MAHESQHDDSAYYADFSSATNSSRMQSLEPSNEILSLQAGMEMLGLPFKQNNNSTYVDTNSASIGQDNFMFGSSEAAVAMTNLWQQQQQLQTGIMMGDESSLKCLFPVQGNQQISQGLSLSLHNPESYDHEDFSSDTRDIARFFPETYHLKDSMYMTLAQELLNEFCSIGGVGSSKHKTRKAQNQWEEGGSSSSASWNHSGLFTMDVLELQKRKAMLLSMLEEVGRKYKRYCDQMRVLVSSFEAVAGEGAATVYSTLASKAMSRHFRSLRDGIVSQIQATKKAMGEKDPVVPGITKGETPRLKILEKCIRQQKAIQQAGVMESQPWRPQRGLPEHSVSILQAWLFEHFLHPYPSDVDKHILSRQTGLSRSQVSNWFINARVRLWKPMVEEMYVEETKEQDNQSSEGTTTENEHKNNRRRQSQLLQPSTKHTIPSPSAYEDDDQEPTLGHLHMNSLSSMISSCSHHLASSNQGGRQQQQASRSEENFSGVIDLDFSSYNNCSSNRSQNVGGNNVSLTLGLQQHTGGGISLSFSAPVSQQSVMFSIIDGEAQNLPYRNLMGAQLLHDWVG